MPQNDDNVFVDGLYAKQPHENAPDFIVARLSINAADMLDFLKNWPDEWVNVDIKESREGKFYAAINDWKPEPQGDEPKGRGRGRSERRETRRPSRSRQRARDEDVDIDGDDIPF